MSPRARRAFFTVVLFFTVCAVVGIVLQRKVGAQSSEDESQLRDSLKTFTSVYVLVADNYAEPLTGDRADDVIYDGAIPGMLHTLDPHSTFYDPKAYAAMRENQSGHYYGVGMVIQQQGEKVYVITPYENTPSYRAGIHPGDMIADIDGKSATGWSSDQVAKALKGPKGTHVQVTMVRAGESKPLVFDLVRDEIPHPSIDLKYEIRPGVGYIHITEFMETTGQEFADALKSFGNLKGLVIDLRGNPGGLLSQAVDVCDQLLAKGQVIVSQRGRAYPDQVYTATHGNGGKDFPIVVLVNRNTASAAEIVSGALQDHDRALIVGQTTFGKGLVQTVYNLSQDTGLALTTYHYYTPSGRLIQRNYEGVSLYDYYYDRAGALPPNSSNREVKFTDSGRTVYGGGGITPDEKIASPASSDFEDELFYAKSAFLHFAPIYVAEHPAPDKNFQVNDAVIGEFEKYLTNQGIDWNQSEIDSDKGWVGAHIKEEVDTIWYGEEDGLQTYAEWDPMIQKAVTFLPQAEALEDTAHKVMAEKAMARDQQSSQGVPMQP